MAVTTLWPVLGSFAAAGGTVALGAYLWRRRGQPGATWLLAVFGVQFLLTAGYGVGFLAFDETLRLAIEMLFWVSYVWLGTLFVGFGLTYTGRGYVIRTPYFAALTLFSVALTLLVVTNPVHGLVWSEFGVVAVGGISAVTFERQAGAQLILGVTSLGASVGTLLLVDTILSYGKLYRGEALAVALSPLPPGIGFVIWTFGVSPFPGINVAPVLFVLHVVLDAYAFVGSGMFEFHPAARRVGNRAAIADLGNPVVVVDDQRRVVNLNPAAEDAFGLSQQTVLTRRFEDCYAGDSVDPTVDRQDIEVRTDTGRRVFRVTSTGLYDSTETHLGHTLVFQDITDERQREQRLAVLNRVLRHNLRNDLNVVKLHLDHIGQQTGDDLENSVDTARRNVAALVALGEKARTFERVADAGEDDVVAVTEVVEDVVHDARADAEATSIQVRGTDSALARTKRPMLEVVLSNLVENAVQHGTPDATSRQTARADGAAAGGDERGDHPDVLVSVAADPETVSVRVRDWGPGVPEQELAVIEDGDESALEHGSGLGLWLVSWGVTSLGGDLSFETGENGTTATVELPVVAADSAVPE